MHCRLIKKTLSRDNLSDPKLRQVDSSKGNILEHLTEKVIKPKDFLLLDEVVEKIDRNERV